MAEGSESDPKIAPWLEGAAKKLDETQDALPVTKEAPASPPDIRDAQEMTSPNINERPPVGKYDAEDARRTTKQIEQAKQEARVRGYGGQPLGKKREPKRF